MLHTLLDLHNAEGSLQRLHVELLLVLVDEILACLYESRNLILDVLVLLDELLN